jgi:tRNA pseudouridine13 synthase
MFQNSVVSSNRGVPSILYSSTQRRALTVRRFTDFLVHEVDQDSNVVHIKSLGIPVPPEKKAKDAGEPASEVNADAPSGEPSVKEGTEAELGAEGVAVALDKIPSKQASSTVPWPDLFTTRLAPFLSTEKIEDVKNLFLEGPEPPFVSDAGWSGRQAVRADESGTSGSMDIKDGIETRKEDKGKRGNSTRGRGRSGRGGRGGKSLREDHRKVTSEVRALPAHAISFTNVPYHSLLSQNKRAPASTRPYENCLTEGSIPRRT